MTNRLILLPGMDGSGQLFGSFVSQLRQLKPTVMELPQSGPQSYEHLATIISNQLPSEPYYLLAESFSGGIVAHLKKEALSNCKAIIFVASFLQSPCPSAVKLAQHLPIQFLAKFPLSTLVHKLLFLGPNAPKGIIEDFKAVIEKVPKSTLKARLQVIYNSKLPGVAIDIPAVYINPTSDRLINDWHADDLKKCTQS